jgi:hypothetical protein
MDRYFLARFQDSHIAGELRSAVGRRDNNRVCLLDLFDVLGRKMIVVAVADQDKISLFSVLKLPGIDVNSSE